MVVKYTGNVTSNSNDDTQNSWPTDLQKKLQNFVQDGDIQQYLSNMKKTY